jgi:Mg2+ and Co2+ transporter CorA
MAGTSGSLTTKARLFDADRSDREVELSAGTVKSIGDHQLLWIDAVLSDEASDTRELVTLLPFDREAVERMLGSAPRPQISMHGAFFLVRVLVLRPSDKDDERVVLDLAVGRNVVLTAHRQPVEFLADLNHRIRGDTTLGKMDSADFATVLMDGVVTTYLELTDEILAAVDTLDGKALKATGRDLLADLVALRHRIAAVRRVLVAHRRVITGMAGADFGVITGKEATPRFAAITERFDGAIDAIDAAREALLGTFDIHMSRTAQRTNDVVKILTIVSVLLLPTGVIAGFMGMNIKAPYANDDPRIFWIVLIAIALIAGITMLALRARKWL